MLNVNSLEKEKKNRVYYSNFEILPTNIESIERIWRFPDLANLNSLKNFVSYKKMGQYFDYFIIS